MWNFTQQDRLLTIKTPLDDDFFLMDELRVKEGISQLYEIEVELLHEEEKAWTSHERDAVDVKDLLGKPVSIEVKQTTDGKIRRFFNGIVSEFSQGGRDEHFSYYWAKIVPLAWVYTQNRDSRIFQQKSVPNILKDVFTKIENKIVWELEYDYQPRNYCVQYRESDFSFASRLMEEEGIYYYFEHLEEGEHKMIVSDKPRFSRDCPTMSEITYFDIGERTDYLPVIVSWDTDYHLKPGKVAFRDHHIQQPNKTLFVTTPSVFDFGDNVDWEVYDFPGRYANKFDGIDPGGGEQAGDLSKIMPDGKNVSKVAMEAIDSRHRIGTARSDCSTLTPGHRFKMTEHPVADVNGEYVVTSVQHTAKQWPPYVPTSESEVRKAWSTEEYVNSFTAQVHGKEGALPFRPLQLTPKPTIYGAQTAAVVGPAGEEIYTDKYGRIKVRFFWDRDGQTDGSDSCWLPVAQTWAGNGWGSMFIPRVGMEVIVHFLDGNPDNPIVDGCVYHPLNMPPYAQPEHKTRSGVKTDSSKGGDGYNELRFEDKKGSEQIFIHGEKDLDVRIKNDRREWTGKDQHLIVQEDLLEKIGKDQGSHHLTIKDDQMIKMGGGHHLNVGGDEAIEIGGTQTVKIKSDQGVNVGASHSLEAGQAIYIKAGMTVVIEAGVQLSLKGPGGFVDIGPAGVTIQGTTVLINSGGAAGSGSAVGPCPPTAPEEPAVADNDKPGKKMELEKQSNDRKKGKSAKEDPKKKSWVGLELIDEAGDPVAGERYEVKTPDGKVRKGSTNNKGQAFVRGIDPGNCEITFPNLDKEAVKEG